MSTSRIRFSLTLGLRAWDEDLLRRIEVAVENLFHGDELVATAKCEVDSASIPPAQATDRRAAAPLNTVSVAAEDNAVLFKAVLLAECPALARAIEDRMVRCLYQPSGPAFSVGRVGTAVWIRFSQAALADLTENVQAAGREAQAMFEGRTRATRVQASLSSAPEVIDFEEIRKEKVS